MTVIGPEEGVLDQDGICRKGFDDPPVFPDSFRMQEIIVAEQDDPIRRGGPDAHSGRGPG